MKLQSITIEGIHNVSRKTYQLNDLTYFYGKNGAGKTTVLNAIQLALLGYIPGTSKTNEAIFRHSNNHTMAVTLVLDDSTKIRRIWTKSSAKVSSSVETVPEVDLKSIIDNLELPIFNFNDFVGMTSNKLKDWFIQFLPGNSDKINWDKEFSKYISDDVERSALLNDAKIAGATTAVGIDGVRQMNMYLKNLLSFKKSELDRMVSTIQSLVHYEDVPDNMTVEYIDDELNQNNELLQKSLQYEAIQKQNDNIRNQIDSKFSHLKESLDTDETAIKLKSDLEIADKQLNEFTVQNYSSVIAELNYDIQSKQKIINSKGVCPYTSASCESISNLKSQYESDCVEIQKSIDKFNAMDKEQTEKLNQLNFNRSILVNQYHKLESEYNERDRLKSLYSEIPEDCKNIDIEFLKQRNSDLINLKSKVLANTQYGELIDKLTEDKFKCDSDITVINKLVKLTDANNMQTTMMESPFINLAHSMDAYMQKVFGKEVSVKFNLSSKANSFNFGLVRDDSYIPFDLLSSGEKCLFTFAMMMCIVNISESPLKLIMIDDMLDHLDTDRVKELFNSLNAVEDIQIILAGVQPYNLNNADTVVQEIK